MFNILWPNAASSFVRTLFSVHYNLCEYLATGIYAQMPNDVQKVERKQTKIRDVVFTTSRTRTTQMRTIFIFFFLLLSLSGAGISLISRFFFFCVFILLFYYYFFCFVSLYAAEKREQNEQNIRLFVIVFFLVFYFQLHKMYKDACHTT